MKYAALIVSLIVGYVIGNVIGSLVGSVLVVSHSVPVAVRAAIGIGCGLLGALAGWARWKNRNTPADIPDIHGSAAWASDKDVRAAYGAPVGLVVGRENTKTGALLRYDGPAHLLTIAPTRSGKGVGAIIPNLGSLQESELSVR